MKSHYILVALFLGITIQIPGIVGPAARPRPPTHIVSSEHHQTRQGCQLETINHLNNSQSFTLYDKINEGHPCPEATTGVCHDGWCMNRESHFGLVTIFDLTFHLTHSVNNTLANVCVTNSSHPASFPLDPIKLHDFCLDYSIDYDHLVGTGHHFVLHNLKVDQFVPETSLVHVQIFEQNFTPIVRPKVPPKVVAQSEHAQYYDSVKTTTSKPRAATRRPPGHPEMHSRPVPVKSVLLGSASFSVHELALDHRAKHDAPKLVNLPLSNSAGQVQVHASWKGALK